MSSTHAELRWSGTGWVVRDMNSMNGTTVNGVALSEPNLVELKLGDVLACGSHEQRWKLVDAGPPRARAARPDGSFVEAVPGGMLSLPELAAPQCQVFQRDQRWIVEQDGEQHVVVDQQALQLGDDIWTLALPPVHHSLSGTIRNDQQEPALERPFSELTLHFTVSRDMEFIGLRLQHLDWEHDLEGRVFNETLYVLAIAPPLAQEAAPDGDAAGPGWLSVDDVLVKAGLNDARQLNQYVFHARRQLEKAGVSGASQLVCRRRVSAEHGMRNELKFGSARFVVKRV